MPVLVKKNGKYHKQTTVAVEPGKCAMGKKPGGEDCVECAFEMDCTTFGVVREQGAK